MIKRIFTIFGIFILFYVGVVQVQLFFLNRTGVSRGGTQTDPAAQPHKLNVFSFSKYTPTGEKEMEIEGDSADILSRTVDLMNVVAKAYAEETPVTITADRGNYDKITNRVHLEENVVATTQNGARLLTEALDIHPSRRVMETDEPAEIKKDNINIDGQGALGDYNLKKVKFKKNVTVVIQDQDDAMHGQTVITCDGNLVIDYEKNIAHFKKNVEAKDERGTLKSDVMDVFYNRVTRRVSKIIATGNVVIENPDGNKTYSDTVIYLADEGRIILGGDTEVLYYEDEAGDAKFFGESTDKELDGTAGNQTT